MGSIKLGTLRKQIGQAMTETLIMSSMFLVPLFLLIPLLGKYIDIKHSTIQAARYEAWEYTVWYEKNSHKPKGFYDLKGKRNLAGIQPLKSAAFSKDESDRRFYSRTNLPIQSSDATLGWSLNDRNALWADHRGNPIWEAGNTRKKRELLTEQETPKNLSSSVTNLIVKAFNGIFNALSFVLDVVGSPIGFTANNLDGFNKTEIETQITVPDGLIDFPNILDASTGKDDSVAAYSLAFTGRAGVLSDSWNAGGRRHVINQSGGMAPIKLLTGLMNNPKFPILKTLQTGVGLIAPELLPCDSPLGKTPFDKDGDGSLWFGYMDVDATHPASLIDSKGKVVGAHQCVDGMCDFNPPHPFPNPNAEDECD